MSCPCCSNRSTTSSSFRPHRFRRDSEGVNLMSSRICRLWRRLKSWPALKRKRWRTSPAGSSSIRWDREGAAADGRRIVDACWWCFLLTRERLKIAWRLICVKTPRASKVRRCPAQPLSAERTPGPTRPATSSDQSNAAAVAPAPNSRRHGRYYDLIVDVAMDRRGAWSLWCRSLLSMWATMWCSSSPCRDFRWTRWHLRAMSKKWIKKLF